MTQQRNSEHTKTIEAGYLEYQHRDTQLLKEVDRMLRSLGGSMPFVNYQGMPKSDYAFKLRSPSGSKLSKP
jgi:hypothetical protein